MKPPKTCDTLIIGAGAAGMMCAAHAAARGAHVALIDHAKSPGEKIRISGGGRCNFTNLNCGPGNFISRNRHFAKSALRRYTQHDFVALVRDYGIAFHEKKLGQLFCDSSARDIISMLRQEMEKTGAQLILNCPVQDVQRSGDGWAVSTGQGQITCRHLVIATGGKSIPKMGATDFGYRIATKFGLDIVPTAAGLVPLTFGPDFLDSFKPLAGVALDARASSGRTAFEEAVLFTHRGLSGPAILQISSYWHEGDPFQIDLLPGHDAFELLRRDRQAQGGKTLSNVLARHLPNRLAAHLGEGHGRIGDLGNDRLRVIADDLNRWVIRPTGSEGYRTAEVTLGGVDTRGLNSNTMEATSVPNLYFIGEVVDVTGWLGGYNFQWAWSSGWAAGTAIAEKCQAAL